MSDNGGLGSPRLTRERVAAIREAAELDVRRIDAMARRLRDLGAYAATAPVVPVTSTAESAPGEQQPERGATPSQHTL
jgi:hypothetical protein